MFLGAPRDARPRPLPPLPLPACSPFASEAPLCDETAKTADPCPLLPGHHNEVSKTQSTVTGKVVTTLTWYDQDGNGVLCAILTTKSS